MFDEAQQIPFFVTPSPDEAGHDKPENINDNLSLETDSLTTVSLNSESEPGFQLPSEFEEVKCDSFSTDSLEKKHAKPK